MSKGRFVRAGLYESDANHASEPQLFFGNADADVDEGDPALKERRDDDPARRASVDSQEHEVQLVEFLEVIRVHVVRVRDHA